VVKGKAFVSILAAGLLHAWTATAQPATAPNDYGKDASWLCRPGRHDACDIDLTTTIVGADGSVSKEDFHAASDPSIDCFYVYPTISTDQGNNSDMSPDPAELNVVAQQAARFRQVCRVFAPSYRQITVAGLRRVLQGGLDAFEQGVQYDDVRDAWKYYLEHDNRGRGVVLIGHSQGAFILRALIAREIEGTPVQRQLVSALLMGTSIGVPKGADVGGRFKTIPLCHAAAQIGCVITYGSYRSTVPPPSTAMFGVADQPPFTPACTNPAALGGGTGELHAYLDAKGQMIVGTTPVKPWTSNGAVVGTPWVSVPGLLTAECKSNEHATYLEVTVHGDTADPRVDDIVGDLGGQRPNPSWGLHLVDINLAMGNFLDIVAQQAKSFAARAK
jgi:hypothetical protein